MQELHQRGQIGLGEILGPHPGIEPFEAEINGVGSVLDGGPHAFPVTRGSEEFRAA